MKKRTKKCLTHKVATILVSILMAMLVIAFTIYLIVAISSNSFHYPTFILLYGLMFAVAPILGICIGTIKPNSKKRTAEDLK